MRTLFYPSKASLAKLLTAQNKIFIDYSEDQSPYLQAALLEPPVTRVYLAKRYLTWALETFTEESKVSPVFLKIQQVTERI